MLRRARIYLEMIRFSHTLFALPFAAIALLIAVKRIGEVRPWDVVGVLACMVFARSAAMGFNRWADRDVDARNPRTANRHIPSGSLSAKQVGLFTVVCSLLFVASTGFFWLASKNWLPLAFSIPMLLFLFGYSLCEAIHLALSSLARDGARGVAGGRLGGDSAAGFVVAVLSARGSRRTLGRGIRRHLRLPGLRRSTARSASIAFPRSSGSTERSGSPGCFTC